MSYDGKLISNLSDLVERIVMCENCGDNLARETRQGMKLCKPCTRDYDEVDHNGRDSAHHHQQECIKGGL